MCTVGLKCKLKMYFIYFCVAYECFLCVRLGHTSGPRCLLGKSSGTQECFQLIGSKNKTNPNNDIVCMSREVAIVKETKQRAPLLEKLSWESAKTQKMATEHAIKNK